MTNFVKLIFKALCFIGRTFTVIRNTFFNVLFILLISFVVFAVFRDKDAEVQQPNGILKLTLSGDIVEELPNDHGIDRFIGHYAGLDPKPRKMLLRNVLDIIETAITDDSINALLLDIKDLGTADLDQLHVIGETLSEFSRSGKKVIAAEDYYSQKQYFIASYADIVILNPMGGVEIRGFGAHRLYFKTFLDKLLVNYHIFRVGTYKSAIEPLTRDDMSPEAASQNKKWLDDLWGVYTRSVAMRRNIAPQQLSDYVENISSNLLLNGGDTALLALNTGLVDKVFTRSELSSFLAEENGQEPFEQPYLISSLEYNSQPEVLSLLDQQDSKNIGIIVAEGNILTGKQPPGLIGSETLSDKLRQARLDDSVKAVVLRINSGGGSAFASEIIRQEILEIKKVGKPVVVSMGGMAASGAYWIAADADRIFASPTTLTGSIGIFGAIPTFEKSLDHIGIHSDGVGSTSLAAGLNIAQPLPDQLKDTIQQTVDNGYDRFLTIVENGRQIERRDLQAIAEGRVFSGTAAQQVGLVDQVGYLQDAVEFAAEQVGLKEYQLRYIEKEGTLGDMIFRRFTEATSLLIGQTVSLPSPLITLLDKMKEQALPITADPKGVYAYAFEKVTI